MMENLLEEAKAAMKNDNGVLRDMLNAIADIVAKKISRPERYEFDPWACRREALGFLIGSCYQKAAREVAVAALRSSNSNYVADVLSDMLSGKTVVREESLEKMIKNHQELELQWQDAGDAVKAKFCSDVVYMLGRMIEGQLPNVMFKP